VVLAHSLRLVSSSVDLVFWTRTEHAAVRFHGADHLVAVLVACPIALELQQHLQGGYRHSARLLDPPQGGVMPDWAQAA
jgi:hypothetical protein